MLPGSEERADSLHSRAFHIHCICYYRYNIIFCHYYISHNYYIITTRSPPTVSAIISNMFCWNSITEIRHMILAFWYPVSLLTIPRDYNSSLMFVTEKEDPRFLRNSFNYYHTDSSLDISNSTITHSCHNGHWLHAIIIIISIITDETAADMSLYYIRNIRVKDELDDTRLQNCYNFSIDCNKMFTLYLSLISKKPAFV